MSQLALNYMYEGFLIAIAKEQSDFKWSVKRNGTLLTWGYCIGEEHATKQAEQYVNACLNERGY